MSRWFEAELTSLAFCWRLDRADGVTLGLTSHDQPLQLAGLSYAAAPGMVPSAIERRSGLAVDTVELAGALTSSLLCEEDLLMGRWDGARLRLYAVDWTQADADPVLLLQGELGNVDVADGQFSVELLGGTQALDQPATPSTSPLCRAQFGDRFCGVDMAGRRELARVTSISGAELRLDSAPRAGYFDLGQLRWAEGPRAGQMVRILAQQGPMLILAEAPQPSPETPLLVELTQGCDRRFATCQSRYGNAENFRGEPHLPGHDVLLRYGG